MNKEEKGKLEVKIFIAIQKNTYMKKTEFQIVYK